MGISYFEMLKMTPKVFAITWKEYEKTVQEQADMVDYTAWLHGLYVHNAINTALSKGGKYMEKSLHEQIREEKFAEEHPEKSAAMNFADYARAFNRGKSES